MKRAFVVGKEDAEYLVRVLGAAVADCHWDPYSALKFPHGYPEEGILSKDSIKRAISSAAYDAISETMTAAVCLLRTLGGETVPNQITSRGGFFLKLYLTATDTSLQSRPRPEGFYDKAFFLMPSVTGWLCSIIHQGYALLQYSKWLDGVATELYNEQERPSYPEY